MRRKKNDPAVDTSGQQQPPPGTYPPPQMGQVHSGSPPFPGGMDGGAYVPPAYDPRYSSVGAPKQAGAYQMVSPDPNTGAFGHPSPVGSPQFSSPGSPDPVKMATGQHGGDSTSPVRFQQHEVLHEAPATNPAGIGNNRVELA